MNWFAANAKPDGTTVLASTVSAKCATTLEVGVFAGTRNSRSWFVRLTASRSACRASGGVPAEGEVRADRLSEHV
ncbi:MAG: hypothetical protein QN131_12000 [Armatimonadota bacterium]|nr:hypothetical protein [Armatimonadota bacterium]